MTGLGAIIIREYKNRMTSPRLIIENIFNPLFSLVIFGTALNSFVGSVMFRGVDIDYIAFFLSGSISIAIINNSVVCSSKVFIDKIIGLNDELYSYPIKRFNIILGKWVFNSIITVIQTSVMIVFVAVVFRFHIVNVLFIYMYIIIDSTLWFLIIMYLSYTVNTQDAFNSIYYIIMTPMIMLSSIYYDPERLPNILRYICSINPLSWTTDFLRGIMLNMLLPSDAFKAILLSVILIGSIFLLNRKVLR